MVVGPLLRLADAAWVQQKSPTGAQKCAAGPPWRDLSDPSRAGSVRSSILLHASAWVKKVMDSGASTCHAGGKTVNVGRYLFTIRDFDAERQP